MTGMERCQIPDQLPDLIDGDVHRDVRENAAALSQVFEHDPEVAGLPIEERAKEDRRLEGHVRPDLPVETDLGLVHHPGRVRHVEHRLQDDPPRQIRGRGPGGIVEVEDHAICRGGPAARRPDRLDDRQILHDEPRTVLGQDRRHQLRGEIILVLRKDEGIIRRHRASIAWDRFSRSGRDRSTGAI